MKVTVKTPATNPAVILGAKTGPRAFSFSSLSSSPASILLPTRIIVDIFPELPFLWLVASNLFRALERVLSVRIHVPTRSDL